MPGNVRVLLNLVFVMSLVDVISFHWYSLVMWGESFSICYRGFISKVKFKFAVCFPDKDLVLLVHKGSQCELGQLGEHFPLFWKW